MTDSRELYSGHGVRVTLDTAALPDGKTKTSARLHRPDVVHLLAFTKTGNILLLREYRPFFAAYIWMLPSGHVDKETDPLEAAQRELREETGFRAESIVHLGTVGTAEKLVTKNHIYVARGLTPDPLPQDEYERIEVIETDLEDALTKIQSSEHVHMPSAYAVLRYLHENPR